MTIKYSLVIPCFNELENIKLLLVRVKDSFCKADIELILVDNGSTDGTKEFLPDMTSKYSFIKYIRVEKNIGYGHGILTGLKASQGKFLAWTHADLQTDPTDALEAFKLFNESKSPDSLFIKGKRSGRSFADTFFTVGMSIFESIIFKQNFWDINAQPTCFSRKFFESWRNPPYDFSLDLYVYFLALKSNKLIKRIPVVFKERFYGESKWNIGLKSKIKFIMRTINYSYRLKSSNKQ